MKRSSNCGPCPGIGLRVFLVSVSLLAVATLAISGASLPAGFSETILGSGLVNPTAMALAPDGRIFVSQQGGQLRVIKNGALLPASFMTVSVDSSGERGLLGIAFDPSFPTNQFIYVYYTVPGAPVHNRVSRFTGNGDVVVPGSEVVLLDLDPLSAATNHNGGGLHFGPDGKLYITVGENANPANSQTLSNRLGKMLRINPDGSIPTDNPFFATATGANRSIWALGLRNPFTFAFQPGTGRMFINDVGENVWEEINDGLAGSNYGWSICEGICTPPNASFRDPLFQYGHGSSPTTGCAITGGAFYNPTTPTFGASYVGKYFYADLCSGWMRIFDPSNATSAPFATGINQPVDIVVASDGSLYYLARGSGAVFRVTPLAPTAAYATISGRILGRDGSGLRNAVVNVVDQAGTVRTVSTNAFGYYRLGGISAGKSYLVWIAAKQYRFVPRVMDLTGDLTGVDFSPEAGRN